MAELTQSDIDQRVLDLYDEYCHGGIDRREFLQRASMITVGGLAMAQALLPRYALAQTISFTDQRIKARYVTYPSPGGTSGTMRGYLVQPSAPGPFPAVLVIHENRGLNPYIEDVARRHGNLVVGRTSLYLRSEDPMLLRAAVADRRLASMRPHLIAPTVAVLEADDVEGLKNKELKALDYTTTAFDKTIPGYLKWSQDWPRGTYKVEIYINGVLDKTINYSVD